MEIDVVSKDGDKVSVVLRTLTSQHNANSITIFWHNIYFHQYNSPAFLSISLHFIDIRHIALNHSAASMTL